MDMIWHDDDEFGVYAEIGFEIEGMGNEISHLVRKDLGVVIVANKIETVTATNVFWRTTNAIDIVGFEMVMADVAAVGWRMESDRGENIFYSFHFL